MVKRIYVYVDGFTLYYRALRNIKFKWLNLEALMRGLLQGQLLAGIEFDSLKELNLQALVGCGEVNHRVHAPTREILQVRFPHEGLTALNGQPAYDTSYVNHRHVAKDCLFSYRGNRYSMPHVHGGKSVLVREPLDSGTTASSVGRI